MDKHSDTNAMTRSPSPKTCIKRVQSNKSKIELDTDDFVHNKNWIPKTS